MNPRLQHMLAALPARQLNLILVGVVLIVAMLAWSVALRAPLAAWRQQGAVLAALEASAPAAQAATTAPPVAPAAPVQAVAVPQPLDLIAAVSRSARKTGVAISSAAQGQQPNVAGLRLQMLDIAASGSYGAVLAWLADIEATQPAVGINGFELQPGATGSERQIRLQLAIYDIGAAP
jgi:type II secretory pathway component PulM